MWSWWQEGSVHRAPWPTDAEVLGAIAQEDEAGLLALLYGAEILSEVRKVKSERKVPLKTSVSRALVRDSPDRLHRIALVERDVRAAGFIERLERQEASSFEVVTELATGEQQA